MCIQNTANTRAHWRTLAHELVSTNFLPPTPHLVLSPLPAAELFGPALVPADAPINPADAAAGLPAQPLALIPPMPVTAAPGPDSETLRTEEDERRGCLLAFVYCPEKNGGTVVCGSVLRVSVTCDVAQ